MKKVFIVLIVFVLTLATVVLADEASHREAVMRLFEIANTRQVTDQVLVSMDKSLDNMLESLNLPPESREAVNVIKKDTMVWFSGFFSWEKLRDDFASIYMEVFSEEEIKELIDFYQSPLGQKMLEKQPRIGEMTTKKTEAILETIMPELNGRLMDSISVLKKKYKTK